MGHTVSKHRFVEQPGRPTQPTRSAEQPTSSLKQNWAQQQCKHPTNGGSQSTQFSSSFRPTPVVRKPIPTVQQSHVRSQMGTQTDISRMTEACGPMGEGIHEECKISDEQTERGIQTPNDPTFKYTANQKEDFESLKEMGFEVNANNVLGSGLFGTVYGGHYNEKILESFDSCHQRINVKVGDRFALKFLDLTSITDSDKQYLDRVFFERERKILSFVNHKNVLPSKLIVHLGQQNWIKYRDSYSRGFWSPDRIAIIMDCADKGDLEDYITKHRKTFTVSLVKSMCFQMAQGLYYLHSKNIVHGDLHEGNVFIFTENGRVVPKLCDFGLSQVVNGTYQPRVGPPQAANEAKIDDVKCLASVFQELISRSVNDKLSDRSVSSESDSPKAQVQDLLQKMRDGSISDITQHHWFNDIQPYHKKA